MTLPDAFCAECELTFTCPAVARCPYCFSAQIRRLDNPQTHGAFIRSEIRQAREKGDADLGDALQRVLDRFERPSLLDETFTAIMGSHALARKVVQ